MEVISIYIYVAFARYDTELHIYIPILCSMEARYVYIVISIFGTTYIGVSVEDGYIAPLHFGVFVYHYQPPAAKVSRVASKSFSEGNIRYEVLACTFLAYILCNIGISRVYTVFAIGGEIYLRILSRYIAIAVSTVFETYFEFV